MQDTFENRIAVVIGASSGIGRSTAIALAQAGAMVSVFARSKRELAEVGATHGDRVLAVDGDAADPRAIDRLFQQTEARFGDCDILVHCAGTIDPRPLVDTSPEQWDQTMQVNLNSVYLACRRALPSMIARRGGVIVNVASISGVPGPQKFPGFVSYCASKAAVIALTEALAVEVKGYGIRVNCVSPGSVDTAMLRRANAALIPDMTTDEVASTILFLASDRSRPINGQNLHVFSA